MKKIMLLGETGCGKTTLSQYLLNQEEHYHKTQQVYYHQNAIDTPGEFFENRFYYNALVSASVEADIIGFVQSIKGQQNYFPPTFSTRFTKPTIGIITKMDLLENPDETVKVEHFLNLAGVETIFPISLRTGVGLTDLTTYLTNED